MRVALLGTRGVPAQYGGFETAITEVGRRLVERGHDVRVYCRNQGQTQDQHLGMQLVNLPAWRRKSFETLSHTALAVRHVASSPVDAAIVFNPANAAFLPFLRRKGIPVAVHMDGLDSKRGKWGPLGRNFYLLSERMAIRWADALIADAEAIGAYYQQRYAAPTVLLRYGMTWGEPDHAHRLDELGLQPGGYHLAVARVEPENHVLDVVQAAGERNLQLPLILVGDTPYAGSYKRAVWSAAGRNGVRLLGSIYDDQLLDALYAGAASYVHGHSVGGTNPSLLRALARAKPVFAHDNAFNREVADSGATFWSNSHELAAALEAFESDSEDAEKRAAARFGQMCGLYNWDVVTDGYEALLHSLQAAGRTRV